MASAGVKLLPTSQGCCWYQASALASGQRCDWARKGTSEAERTRNRTNTRLICCTKTSGKSDRVLAEQSAVVKPPHVTRPGAVHHRSLARVCRRIRLVAGA